MNDEPVPTPMPGRTFAILLAAVALLAVAAVTMERFAGDREKVAPPTQETEGNTTMSEAIRILNAQTFQATVASGVTLVDFWAPWCVPCRKQAPILDAVAATMGDRAVIAKCNTDDEGELAAQFGIQFIPTLIIFRDGREVKRFSSVQDEDTLVAALNAALGNA